MDLAIRDTRIIVATSSLALFELIRRGFMTRMETETITRVANAGELLGAVNRVQKNFILIDLDSVPILHNYINQLVERHQVRVVLTAISKVTAISLLKGNIRDFIAKPLRFDKSKEESYIQELSNLMRGGSSNIRSLSLPSQQKLVDSSQKIIAIASSTGGTDALEKIFRELPAEMPPILVVQHMPSGFTKLFADRLNGICQIEIKEAVSNDYLQKGCVLIAPADLHMVMVKRGARLSVECYKGSKIHGVMPAADVLFDSIAPIMRKNVMGVILTGMGTDGAIGMRNMHNSGAFTVGQDKATSVIYGMPKAAYELGAVDIQLPLSKIPEKMIDWAQQ